MERITAMGAVDKIFDNFEMLYENYTDMPETRKARNDLFRHMEAEGMDLKKTEHYISGLISEYERQGFVYGFRYAASLFLDGTVQYGCSRR